MVKFLLEQQLVIPDYYKASAKAIVKGGLKNVFVHEMVVLVMVLQIL